MFSSPSPAPGSRGIASNALRSAGLIDRDAPMRDVSDKPGGRKGSNKIRGHKQRPIDLFKDHTPGAGPRMGVATRSHRSDPTGRSVVAGRMRRNPVYAVTSTASSRAVERKGVDAWREFVQKRWNPEARFLNLESMIDDEIVKKHNLLPPGRGGNARDAAVIFKLASQLTPEVKTLSLANNNLAGVHLTYLSHYLPNLANLSLQGNNLKTWKDLDYISSRKEKMIHLRELILLGNPVRELEFQNGRGDRYKTEMTRRCTSLEVLDQETVTQISFDVPQPSTSTGPAQHSNSMTFPCEMGPSFVTGVDGALVSNFLVRFLNIFDSQRAALLEAYDPAATFSFSANTAIPTRARLEGHHVSRDMPNQKNMKWGPWLNGGAGGSRNLSRIGGGFDKTVRSLHVGAEEAIKALADLPGTKHDIGGPPEKFCIDSFPVVHGQGMGLLLVVHGQFTEVDTEGIRSFDRTFVLAPAGEGSRAKLAGWDVVILSDQWIIRGYSSHEAWKPGPMLVQARSRPPRSSAAPPGPHTPSLPVDQQAALAAIPDLQRPLVLRICEHTKLNVKYAVDCLAGNSWDFDKAVANFNGVKGTLPREAFL